MKIIKQDKFEWQDKKGYSKKILFDQIEKDKVVVQNVKIKAGETAKSHFHKIQTEIFYFTNSNGHWIINGKIFKPRTRDIIVVEPNDKHAVVNDTKKDYLYIAFKYNYNPEDIFWD